MALARILLLGGPVVAGVMAGRRYCGPGSPQQLANAKWQGALAGFLATGVGAVVSACAQECDRCPLLLPRIVFGFGTLPDR